MQKARVRPLVRESDPTSHATAMQRGKDLPPAMGERLADQAEWRPCVQSSPTVDQAKLTTVALLWTPCMRADSLLLSRFSHVRLCVTPQTAAHQAPQSLGFSRHEHWSGLPFPSPERGLPDPGIEPPFPALAGEFFTTEPPGKPLHMMSFCPNITGRRQRSVCHFSPEKWFFLASRLCWPGVPSTHTCTPCLAHFH